MLPHPVMLPHVCLLLELSQKISTFSSHGNSAKKSAALCRAPQTPKTLAQHGMEVENLALVNATSRGTGGSSDEAKTMLDQFRINIRMPVYG